jgi:hypothetical protein
MSTAITPMAARRPTRPARCKTDILVSPRESRDRSRQIARSLYLDRARVQER